MTGGWLFGCELSRVIIDPRIPADRVYVVSLSHGFRELTDPPLRRTPPRPRTWPRGKWFALSRRRRKSPPIGW